MKSYKQEATCPICKGEVNSKNLLKSYCKKCGYKLYFQGKVKDWFKL